MKKIKTVTCNVCGKEFDVFSPGKRTIPESEKVCLRCESGEAPHGHIKKALNDYKKVGDFALAKRDSFSKWEKEAKDKEYADSSRMAAAKLQAEKKPDNGISLTQEQRSKIFRSPDAIQKYIKTGEY